MISADVFAGLLRTYAVIVLAWITCAFLMCGLMIFQRDVPQEPKAARATMVTCLFIWPVALLLQIVAWLTGACWWVFDPDHGPVALLAQVLKAAALNRTPKYPAVIEVHQPPPPTTVTS